MGIDTECGSQTPPQSDATTEKIGERRKRTDSKAVQKDRNGTKPMRTCQFILLTYHFMLNLQRECRLLRNKHATCFCKSPKTPNGSEWYRTTAALLLDLSFNVSARLVEVSRSYLRPKHCLAQILRNAVAAGVEQGKIIPSRQHHVK